MKKKDPPEENGTPIYDLEELEEMNTDVEEVENLENESPTGPEARVQELEEALKKEKSDALYARAEFDNFRRRSIKERSDIMKYAGERGFAEILTVLDNFERAIKASENTTDEVLKKGVVMIADELRNTLKRFGITEILPEKNKFDPTLFEAISTEETDAVAPGEISQVFRKAYRLHDKVIRPGQVVIAQAPKNNSSNEEKE